MVLCTQVHVGIVLNNCALTKIKDYTQLSKQILVFELFDYYIEEHCGVEK